jgi:hypothetical protein
MTDPWKHRSSGMPCATCMWFAEKVSENTRSDDLFGRCRRHCPTMNGFPAVFGRDWCGDHKPDENKRQAQPEPEYVITEKTGPRRPFPAQEPGQGRTS